MRGQDSEKHSRWRFCSVLLVCFLSVLPTACNRVSSDASPATPSGEAANLAWPRTITGAHGAVMIQNPPHRIVSTSVTLTGTLLAIDAPVVASGASQPRSTVTDKQGFFTQWSEVAKARGVQPLYQGEPNAETIMAANPDLILVSATGGDSAFKLYEQIRQIAPTLIVNYDDKSWQELARLLGWTTGRETEAETVIQQFAKQITETRYRLRLPPQPTTAMVYYEDGSGANVWTADSAQGQLLIELGFELAQVPDSVKGNTSMGQRRDIIQISGERFAEGLLGQTLLLFSADEQSVQRVKNDRFLAQSPAIRNDRVYAMGLDTFRLDYYSSTHLLQRLSQLFQ